MAALKATSAIRLHGAAADGLQAGRSAPSEPGFVDALAAATQDAPKAGVVGSNGLGDDVKDSPSASGAKWTDPVLQPAKGILVHAGVGMATDRWVIRDWLAALANAVPDLEEGEPADDAGRANGIDAAPPEGGWGSQGAGIFPAQTQQDSFLSVPLPPGSTAPGSEEPGISAPVIRLLPAPSGALAPSAAKENAQDANAVGFAVTASRTAPEMDGFVLPSSHARGAEQNMPPDALLPLAGSALGAPIQSGEAALTPSYAAVVEPGILPAVPASLAGSALGTPATPGTAALTLPTASTSVAEAVEATRLADAHAMDRAAPPAVALAAAASAAAPVPAPGGVRLQTSRTGSPDSGKRGLDAAVSQDAPLAARLDAVPASAAVSPSGIKAVSDHDTGKVPDRADDAWPPTLSPPLSPIDASPGGGLIATIEAAGFVAQGASTRPAALVGVMSGHTGLSLHEGHSGESGDGLGAAGPGQSGQLDAPHRSEDGLPGGDQQHGGDRGHSGSLAQAGGLSAGRASSAHAGVPATVTDQVVAAVEAMSHRSSSTGRVSVSITPDELGRIGITVERQANGTTTIHVQAERLATLDLLRTDQAALVRALDQSGHGRDDHALSFSWDNGGGHPGQGGARWGMQDEQHGGPSGVETGRGSYPDARLSLASSAAARGGVDVTA